MCGSGGLLTAYFFSYFVGKDADLFLEQQRIVSLLKNRVAEERKDFDGSSTNRANRENMSIWGIINIVVGTEKNGGCA